METKIRPATKLPWYPAYGFSTGCVHSVPLNEQSAKTRITKSLPRADAAYIVHTANAYSRLVALARMAQDKGDVELRALAHKLLSELGEE